MFIHLVMIYNIPTLYQGFRLIKKKDRWELVCRDVVFLLFSCISYTFTILLNRLLHYKNPVGVQRGGSE